MATSDFWNPKLLLRDQFQGFRRAHTSDMILELRQVISLCPVTNTSVDPNMPNCGFIFSLNACCYLGIIYLTLSGQGPLALPKVVCQGLPDVCTPSTCCHGNWGVILVYLWGWQPSFDPHCGSPLNLLLASNRTLAPSHKKCTKASQMRGHRAWGSHHHPEY